MQNSMWPESLFDKKVLLITGKGGVGKTLLTASLGLKAAEAGKRVLLVEANIEDQLAPLLTNRGAIGHNLTFVRERLAVINLDPNKNFRDFVVMHLGFAKIFDQIFTKPLVQGFVRMIPGIAEVTILGRLYFHAMLDLENRFDLIIFDGFSSGHFRSLLSTPDAVLQSGFVGPIIKETQRVRDFLADRSLAATIVATLPEPLVLSETLEFLEDLNSQELAPPAALVVNRFLQPADRPRNDQDQTDFETISTYLRSLQYPEALAGFLSSLPPINADMTYFASEQFYFAEPLAEHEILTWLASAQKYGG